MRAVADVIRSGVWTGGEVLRQFEASLREHTGAAHIVCVSSGTAAIQAILRLVRRPGRRQLLVTSALNFVAAPAVALSEGYDLALTDIDEHTLTMAPDSLAEVLAGQVRGYDQIVVMPVHFAGHPAEMDRICSVTANYGGQVLEDACHALGARYTSGGRAVGSHPGSGGAVFSFHPTKPVAAGEGGAVAVPDPELAERLRLLRNHNMRRDGAGARSTAEPDGVLDPWHYEVAEPGLNLRLSELHAAVGLVQSRRLAECHALRVSQAGRYRDELAGPGFRFFPPAADGVSAWHLFPVSFDLDALGVSRRDVFDRYRAFGVRPQVHYIPLTHQPAFAGLPGVLGGSYPVLEAISPGLLSLPLFPGMAPGQQATVIQATRTILGR